MYIYIYIYMDFKKKYLKYKKKYLSLNQHGGTALTQAIVQKNLDRVKELLDEGVNPNELDPSVYNNMSNLQITIKYNLYPFSNLLLEKGADINYINSSGDSCLRLAYLNFLANGNFNNIIFSLFHKGVIIDDKARDTIITQWNIELGLDEEHISRRLSEYRPNSLGVYRTVIIKNRCLDNIDQAKIGNIEYFKTEYFNDELYFKDESFPITSYIWVNYLPKVAYQELLLWTKTNPEKISTLFGRTGDDTKPIDHQENREKVASEGLISSNIIDFIPSNKKIFYDQLVKFRL